MNFLHPTILWGLLAIAVPIIIHFFNLQRPKLILFSNIEFVKEVKKNVTRRIKLRQWLLLAARILAITMAVLAFATPVWVSQNTKMLRGNRSVAIVIDNSYSMTAGNEKGAYLQQAISLTRNIVNTYTPQDEILLMTTGGMRYKHNFGEREEILEELPNVKIQQRICSENEILNNLSKIFERSNNVIREIYFLSDFQASSVMADTGQIKLASDTSMLIKFVPLATREQKNVYLTSHKISSQIIEKNKPVKLTFTLVNDGENEVKELGIRVLIEGKVAALAAPTIASKSSQEVNISFSPTASGWQSGYIELDDYPIEFDNKRYFSFYVPEKEKILVVEGERSNGVHILYQDLFNQFEPTFISEKAISTVQFSDYKSVVISGLTDVSSGLSEQLSTFIKAGGGLMIFPGSNANLTNINAFLQGIGVGKFDNLVSNQTGSKASQADLKHTLFEGVFAPNQRTQDFDAPMVFKYYPFQAGSGAVQGKVISMENGNSILTEAIVGKGRMFLWSLFAGDAWSDLHVKTLFAPVMYRATQMMSRTQAAANNQELGKYTPMSVQTTKQDLIKLIGDKDLQYIPEQYVQSEATMLGFDKLDMKEGNYRIMQGETQLDRVSFNISDQESKLAFITKGDLADDMDKKGLSQVQVLAPEPHAITSTITVEKEGTPLWKYFIFFALLFLVAEILILRIGDGTSEDKKI